MPFPTSEPDINNYLLQEAGRITFDIAERVLAKSAWPSIVRRVPWPEEMGEVVSNVEWQRPYVEDPEAWSNVSINDGSGTSCLPPVDIIEINQKLREMRLQHKAIESPEFCVTDLFYTAKRQRQMGAVVTNLSEQARWTWVERIRQQYTLVAKNMINLEANLDGYGTDYEGTDTHPSTTLPTSILTNGCLDMIYQELLLEGAAEDAMAYNMSKPVFGLITDIFTSRKLQRADDAVREDIRNTSEAESFLGPLGIDVTYNGYVHMIEEMPRRFDWVEGSNGYEWVERRPYVKVTDSNNTTIEVNPLWLAAKYQDSYVWCPGVMNLLVPPSISGAAGAEYDPVNYMGEYSFKNIPHKSENPDGTMGFFRGVLMSGTESLRPQWAWVIRHQVADRDLGLIDITAGA